SASDTDIEFGPLDQQIGSLLEALRAVDAHIQSRVSNLRRRRNNLSFIHRLPFEILVEIFRSVTDGVFFSHRYYQVLGTLTGVCTLWASIIGQAPTLWTVVFDHYDLRLVDKIIDKSGNYPLSLLSRGWYHQRPIHETAESFLKRLCPTAYRWKAAEFSMGRQEIRDLETCLRDLSAPKLKKLCVVGEDGSGSSVELFRGGAGHLEELDLTAVSINQTSSLLSGLRILRLKYLNHSLTTRCLLVALMRCPNLSELRINSCALHESTTSDDLPARLELPHLNILDLCLVTPSAAISILTRISSPKYTYFRLVPETLQEVPSTDDILQSISHHIPSLRHLIVSAAKLAITLGWYNCQCIAGLPWSDPFFELSIDHDSPTTTVLAWITEAFAGVLEGVATKIVIGFYRALSEEDLAIMCRIPLINALRISGNQTSLLRHLSTPTLVNGKEHWPLPKLATLIIEEDHYNPDEILDMVESRYELRKPTSNAQLPSRFSSLVINGSGTTLGDHTVQQIRSIVGENFHLKQNMEDSDTDLDSDLD
ncbi:hypothetical protein FRB99_002463, partial [Tulasnella sp. 403]